MSTLKVLIGSVFLLAWLIAAGSTSAGPGPITFVVSNTADDGPGSFRQAITDSNGNPGPDFIHFNIPADSDPGCNFISGVCSISPTTILPAVTDPVEIDGFTQPGSVPNSLALRSGTNAQLKIEVNGSLTDNSEGLILLDGASGSLLRGLVINSFWRPAVVVNGTGIDVQGNFIGTDATGMMASRNGVGVLIYGRNNNLLGGDSPEKVNLISANRLAGVQIEGVAVGGLGQENIIQGNLVGTRADGSDGLGNQYYGIRFESAAGNMVLDNVIASNLPGGFICFFACSDNVLRGNVVRSNYTQFPGGGGDGIAFSTEPYPTAGLQVIDNTVVDNGRYGIGTGLAVDSLIAGNTVTGNGDVGIGFASRVRATQNRVWNNGGLGLEISPFGVTPNDPGDHDGLQNYPDITLAETDGSLLHIVGRLDSTPNTQFALEFFVSGICDTSGYGEGESILGSMAITTGSHRRFL
jgi:parallel beta-helix repeat protein